MFTQNPLVGKNDFFISNDVNSFISAVARLVDARTQKYNGEHLIAYRALFDKEIHQVYNKLLV